MAESKELKPLDVIAKEVIAGKWGKGSECRERLEKAGYNYNDVFRWVGYLKRQGNFSFCFPNNKSVYRKQKAVKTANMEKIKGAVLAAPSFFYVGIKIDSFLLL